MFAGLSAAERLLVVVAHPDDETFGCGSLLLRAAAEGMVTSVCCATRGEAGTLAPGVAAPSAGLGALREQELRDAARLLGVGDLVLLDYRDSGITGPVGVDTLCGADAEEVRAAVAEVADRFRPEVVVTLDASDGHRDHARVRDAALAVAAERDLPAYLQCLPRSLMARWVAHVNQTRPDAEYLTLGDLGTPDDEITLVLDQADYLTARERAMRAHASQTSPFDGLPDELRHAFLASDHLRRVR